MKDNESVDRFHGEPYMTSYLPQMNQVPTYLNTHFKERNFLLIFPSQENDSVYKKDTRDIANASDFLEISNIIGQLFK